MTFLVSLALRNVLRQRMRTLLSMSAVVAGVWVSILGHGFIRGVNENLIRAAEDTTTGHVLLRPAGYPIESMAHPVDALPTVSPELRAWLDAHTKSWTTRTLFTPTLVAGSDRLRVRAIGFDPDRDESVFPRPAWKVAGTIPRSAADGVLLGRNVAKLLNLAPGAHVVLQARTSKGAINALDVPVAGVVSVGNPMIDFMGILVPADLARDLIRSEDGVTNVAMRIGDRDAAPGVASEVIAVAGAGWEVTTWIEETRDLMALQQVRQRALDLLVGMLLLMSAAAIANTVLMAAYERVREIGTLRAMGMTQAAVLVLFVLEGGAVGTVGGTLGAALGAAACRYGSIHGIDLSRTLEQQGTAVPMSSMLYLAFSPEHVLTSLAFGVVVAMLASVYPAYVAARMAPADAVRAA